MCKVIQKTYYKEFDAIAEYEYKDNLYWVTNTGELNDTAFESNNVYVITLIN